MMDDKKVSHDGQAPDLTVDPEKGDTVLTTTGLPTVTKEGLTVHPQPTADLLDPLNWSWTKKHTILAIVMFKYIPPHSPKRCLTVYQILHVYLHHDHNRPLLCRAPRVLRNLLRASELDRRYPRPGTRPRSSNMVLAGRHIRPSNYLPDRLHNLSR